MFELFISESRWHVLASHRLKQQNSLRLSVFQFSDPANRREMRAGNSYGYESLAATITTFYREEREITEKGENDEQLTSSNVYRTPRTQRKNEVNLMLTKDKHVCYSFSLLQCVSFQFA